MWTDIFISNNKYLISTLDGFIEESDELGSAWLDRFGSNIDPKYLSPVSTNYYTPDSSWTIIDDLHKFGFGDYRYD